MDGLADRLWAQRAVGEEVHDPILLHAKAEAAAIFEPAPVAHRRHHHAFAGHGGDDAAMAGKRLHPAAVDVGLDVAGEEMGPLAADLDQAGAVGAISNIGVERIERDRIVRIARYALPELPDLDGGCDLVARGQPAHPAGATVDRVVRGIGRTGHAHWSQAGVVAAGVARLLPRRQDRADVEERTRRSPIGEVIAQRKGADWSAGDVVAALAVLRVGEAGEQRQIGRQLLAAMDAGRERAGRSERADAVTAIDLLVDAKQHRSEHAVGDHLVEALIGEAADRVAAGIGAGRSRA